MVSESPSGCIQLHGPCCSDRLTPGSMPWPWVFAVLATTAPRGLLASDPRWLRYMEDQWLGSSAPVAPCCFWWPGWSFLPIRSETLLIVIRRAICLVRAAHFLRIDTRLRLAAATAMPHRRLRPLAPPPPPPPPTILPARLDHAACVLAWDRATSLLAIVAHWRRACVAACWTLMMGIVGAGWSVSGPRHLIARAARYGCTRCWTLVALRKSRSRQQPRCRRELLDLWQVGQGLSTPALLVRDRRKAAARLFQAPPGRNAGRHHRRIEPLLSARRLEHWLGLQARSLAACGGYAAKSAREFCRSQFDHLPPQQSAQQCPV